MTRPTRIRLHDQLANPGVKSADLVVAIARAPLGAFRKYLRQTLHRLAFPGANVVGIHLVLRRDLLERPIRAKRLQRLLSRLPPALPADLHSSVKRWNTP